MKNIILIPVYNDWKSVNLLLFQINNYANKVKKLQILIVNDASTQKINLKKNLIK